VANREMDKAVALVKIPVPSVNELNLTNRMLSNDTGKYAGLITQN